MGSINKRLENLERLVGPSDDGGSEYRRTVVRGILSEFARLKACRAVHYRARMCIEPEDIPARILGPDYTAEQLWDLAARRVSEREDRRG